MSPATLVIRVEDVLEKRAIVCSDFERLREEWVLQRDLWGIADELAERVGYPFRPRSATAIRDLVLLAEHVAG